MSRGKAAVALWGWKTLSRAPETVVVAVPPPSSPSSTQMSGVIRCWEPQGGFVFPEVRHRVATGMPRSVLDTWAFGNGRHPRVTTSRELLEA